MLHKSFKPAKCKTALKLSASRIKLLKNKREAHVKQLKRELAQLLEAGQDQTARIRVEHVVREEKAMAAYDLIEIYCELIVARMPIIESQKNCPIDLKEAISSVIFASPRCADIPELMDVRKHFLGKYGKEFVSAAVELRPDCGVSRLLVEKLSAKAPDGPTKLKILSGIAEEHNVKWDPTSFGEKDMKPPEDLLNGPNTFEQASKMHVEPPGIQEPPSSVDRGHSNFKAPSNYYDKDEQHVNSYGSNSRSSQHSQNVHSPSVGSSQAMPSGTSRLDPRTIGTGSEEMGFRHSYAAEQSGFSVGKQSWNMEFKDATAAAQAAAESAELASMAARAAAELSSQGRITRQHSTESMKASVFRSTDEALQSCRVEGQHLAKDPVNKTTPGRITRQNLTESDKASVLKSRDEKLQRFSDLRVQGEVLAKDSVNNIPHGSNSRMNHEESFKIQQDDLAGLAKRFNNLKNTNEPFQLASSKSSSSYVDDYPQVNDFQMAESHFRKKSSELEKSDLMGDENIKGESSDTETELASEMHDEMGSENVGYFGATNIRKQFSSASSHSQIPTDDHNVFSSFSHQKFSKEAAKEPYIFHEGNFENNTTNSYDNASVVFDDSGSDDDGFKLDQKGGYNGHDSYNLSEGRKSHFDNLANTSANSTRLNTEESLGMSSSQSPFASNWHTTSVFSEGLASDTVLSHADESLPVTFDDSDGPSSESEGELNKSKLVGSTRGGTSHKDVAYSGNTGTTQNERHQFSGASVAEKENVGSNRKNQGNEAGAETDRKFRYGYLHNNPTSRGLAKSQSKSNNNSKTSLFSSVEDDIQSQQSLDNLEDAVSPKESSLESGKELNFGILTGGLRNKGYRHPPYRRNLSGNSSVSKQAEEDNSTSVIHSSSSRKVDIGSGASDQEPYSQLMHAKTDKKASLGTPISYFSVSEDESDEELPQQTREPYVQKASPEVNKESGLRSYFDIDNSDSEEDLSTQTVSKTRQGPGFSRRTKQTVTSNTLPTSERKSYLKSTLPSDSSTTAEYAMERKSSSSSSRTWSKNSDNRQRSEQHRSAEPSRPIQEPKRSSQDENHKSLASEQPSNPPFRTVSSGSGESTKASRSKDTPPSRENSINKANHVHPKLPDYDALTAHLLSLRQNRQ